MSEEIRSAIALIAGALVLVVCYIKIFLKGRSFNQKFMENVETVFGKPFHAKFVEMTADTILEIGRLNQKSRGVIQRLRL